MKFKGSSRGGGRENNSTSSATMAAVWNMSENRTRFRVTYMGNGMDEMICMVLQARLPLQPGL